MALEKFLKNLGLDEKNQQVYIALFKLGDATVARIAQESQIKRTTVYHVLENLKEKGLISSYTEKGVKRFVAESPQKLKNILEGQMFAFKKYLPQLQSFYNLAGKQTVIKLFTGKEGAKQISEDALTTKEKIIYSMGSIKNAKQATGVSIRFTERRVAKKILEKALRIEKEFDEDYVQRQQKELKKIKFLPQNLEIPVLIQIYDNKVGVICSQKEKFSFIIESEEFSETMKMIFQTLWDISN